MPFGVGHLNVAAYLYTGVVELPVNFKSFAVNLNHIIFFVLTITTISTDPEIEFVTFLLAAKVRFEFFQGILMPEQENKWMITGCFLNELFRSVIFASGE